MRSVGLSKQKSAYLKDLATKTAAGALDFSRLSDLPDDEVIEHLTQVKGIGVWTAQMFLMFTLKRENVLPTGDFGVRMAMYKHYLDAQRAKAAKKCWSHPEKICGPEETQAQDQAAHSRANGKNRKVLGALSQRCVLVFVAEYRHENALRQCRPSNVCSCAARAVVK